MAINRPEPWEDVLKRWQVAGRPEDFGALLEAFRPRHLHYARQRLGPQFESKDDAQDVVQDAYLVALRRSEAYRKELPCSFRFWLTRLVRDECDHTLRRFLGAGCRDLRRERRLTPPTGDSSAGGLDDGLAASQTTPSQAVALKEFQERFRERFGHARAALNQAETAVYNLRYVLSHTNRETAELLGIAESAAAMRYSRLNKKLERALQGLSGPGRSSQGPESELDPRLVEIENEFADRLAAGDKPDIEEYAARHPDVADAIRPALQAVVRNWRFENDAGEPSGGAWPPVGPPPVIAGYRGLREIGRGGMGVVYEARQVALDRDVALKVLFPVAGEGPTAAARRFERFRNEGTAAGRLHHTHIVPVYEFGGGPGLAYYTMPLIRGASLGKALRDRPEGPREALREWHARAARAGTHVAEALQFAHEHGIVHRDVKPGNVLLDGLGEAWLADFGLAHLCDRGQTGDASGSQPYMAPEQHAGLAEPASDQFGLGVSLYEFLSGKRPFPGPSPEDFARQKRNGEFRPLEALRHDLPRDLARVVRRALAPYPADRYPTAGALAEDLRRCRDGFPLAEDAGKLHVRLWRWSARRRAEARLTLAVVALVVAIVGGVVWRLRADAVRQALRSRAEFAAAARAALDRGDMAAGDRLFTRALGTATGPDLPLLVDRLRCRFALGDWEALDAELLALSRREGLGTLRPTVLLLRGDYLLSHQGKGDEAQALVREALASRPDLSPSDVLYAEGLLADGAAEALDRFRRAADHGPRVGRYHRAHMTLAAELLAQGRLADARRQLDHVRRTFPGDPLGALLEAMLLVLTGDRAAALALVDGLGPQLGPRAALLREFLGTFADSLKLLEGFNPVGGGLPPGDHLKLLANATRLGKTAGMATAALGFPTPAAARLYKLWSVVPPMALDWALGRLEKGVARLSEAEGLHPEGMLLYFRAAFRLRLAHQFYSRNDRDRLRPLLEAMTDDALRATDAPTLAPTGPHRYQSRLIALVGDEMLIQEFGDRPEFRRKRIDQGIDALIVEGRKFPRLRAELLAILAPGFETDEGVRLVSAWQYDERLDKQDAYWAATRLRARFELKAGNETAALRAAEEVLVRFPGDGAMAKLRDEANTGLRRRATSATAATP